MRSWKMAAPFFMALLWAGCRLLRFPDCPGGMVEIEDYCIDRWEAHLVDQSPYQVPVSGRAATASDVIPQGYISADVAEVACRKAGKRLCTSTEWLRACQGPERTTFPYGNTYDESACNEGREVHPIVELFGSDADWSAAQMNDPRLNQLPNSLDPTGTNPQCVTAEGIYDMHGNLHEWVSDSDGTFRGGFYVDAEINGRGCLYRTTAHSRPYHDYSTGFRCCADPS
jgi:formylglycine-generating enzyme required for sulfatase activity